MKLSFSKLILSVSAVLITSTTVLCQTTETFITNTNDTLTQDLLSGYHSDIGIVTYELNRVNGKLNGPSIGYHRNGSIYSIVYYYNDRPWECKTLIDSFGKQHCSGTLKKGTGQLNFISDAGIDLGYETYKDGHREGKFHRFAGQRTSLLEGELSFRSDLIRYDTMTFVNFTLGKDTIRTFLQNGKCNDVVCGLLFNDSTKSKTKILTQETLIYVKAGNTNSVLDIYLEQGEIPIGHWQLSNKEKTQTLQSYEFSKEGKLLSVTYYKVDGTVSQKVSY